jgi:glycosyltransferase involved in cell wall biosynthesis
MTSWTQADNANNADTFDLVCFSHLRWDFVYQRPQHLLSRFAAEGRVFYIEEPVFTTHKSHLVHSRRNSGVDVVVPHVSNTDDVTSTLQFLIDDFFRQQQIHSYALWFYTPMHLPWTRHLKPVAVVYDCMDELSGFKGAPPEMKEREAQLLQWADLVFTGGHSLYEAKRQQHHSIYPFPSSIDAPHFARARTITTEPDDQANIPGLRLGFFGVIDERMDLDLIAAVAAMRPEWHLILIGPVVKIDPASLPQLPNIHYLGMKTYDELPCYISGWDVAILPFARNDSTRFISPTKTPEYLAAGLPVVSTSIRDVIFPYGNAGIVHIADTPEEFIVATEKALAEDPAQRVKRVDALLSQTSWSRTWGRMAELLEDAIQRRKRPASVPRAAKQLAAAAAAGGPA